MPIICEGCGQVVPIPSGYHRNKIQCACGIICPVPESARQEAEAVRAPTATAPPALSEETERWQLVEDVPAPVAPPKAETSQAEELVFNCRRCGRRVRRQGECPSCDADSIPAERSEPVWPSVDDPDDEDAGPPQYAVEGAEEIQCPKCSKGLPPDAVLCIGCGFHLKKRKKIVKTFEPVDRQWETNAPLRTRLTAYLLAEVLVLIQGVAIVSWAEAKWGGFMAYFVVFSAMMSFLLGTFDRIHLTRDARGRTRLTKTWRICFVPRPADTTDVRGYEGIVSSLHQDIGFWDYFVLVVLLVSGVIPGIIWWYFVMYKPSLHLSLTRDHGHPVYLVYAGSNEKQMKEIAFALREASGLPCEVG